MGGEVNMALAVWDLTCLLLPPPEIARLQLCGRCTHNFSQLGMHFLQEQSKSMDLAKFRYGGCNKSFLSFFICSCVWWWWWVYISCGFSLIFTQGSVLVVLRGPHAVLGMDLGWSYIRQVLYPLYYLSSLL